MGIQLLFFVRASSRLLHTAQASVTETRKQSNNTVCQRGFKLFAKQPNKAVVKTAVIYLVLLLRSSQCTTLALVLL